MALNLIFKSLWPMLHETSKNPAFRAVPVPETPKLGGNSAETQPSCNHILESMLQETWYRGPFSYGNGYETRLVQL